MEVYIDAELKDLIPGFLENRRQDVKEIERLLNEGKFEEIQRIGHSMKGSGSGYGFDEVSKIGKDIEEAAKKEDTEKIEKLKDRLNEYLSQVKVVFREED